MNANIIDRIVGRPRPARASGPYNIRCNETEKYMLGVWVDSSNVNFFYEYYVKRYTQFTFSIVRR